MIIVDRDGKMMKLVESWSDEQWRTLDNIFGDREDEEDGERNEDE